ncbi:MAG: PhoH family protein [Deltaproteobacteria bacterium]|jgi:phosphate starvation-inducible PhoH-like protein|nr:PhoH family protein [Deltaproteobacteria bacterium]
MVKIRNGQEAKNNLERPSNGLMPGRARLGSGSINLKILSEILGLSIGQRGDELIFTDSDPVKLELAKKALTALAIMPVQTETPSQWEVECLANLLRDNPELDPSSFFDGYSPQVGQNRQVVAKTMAQRLYLEAMAKYDLVFGLGPAGTGKTYLAVAMAAEALNQGKVSRLILTRPAVEAGERLGFLPGDLSDKIDPYLRPLYDALTELIPTDKLVRMHEKRLIEVAPLAFMRGRTLSGAFVILDEAQNTTTEQMKMFLTRIGPGSRAVVTGDPDQSDLPGGRPVGLLEAMEILPGIEGLAFCHFRGQDVVRHRLVRHILAAYERKSKKGLPGEVKP